MTAKNKEMRNEPLTQEEVAQLKSELSAVLQKYNVYIAWNCGECSDLHGVYDERIGIYAYDRGKTILEVSGGSLFAGDLE